MTRPASYCRSSKVHQINEAQTQEVVANQKLAFSFTRAVCSLTVLFVCVLGNQKPSRKEISKYSSLHMVRCSRSKCFKAQKSHFYSTPIRINGIILPLLSSFCVTVVGHVLFKMKGNSKELE